MTTYNEIKRQFTGREIGSYESELFMVTEQMGADYDGDDACGYGNRAVETTCTVRVYLLGDQQHGYILVTRDDADGPSDDRGRTVYATAAEAVQAARAGENR